MNYSALSASFPRNFSLREMIHSDTAIQNNIDNFPYDPQIQQNLIRVAWVLQEIRDKIEDVTGVERSITVTSGYRCYKLNGKIGSSTSAHFYGNAVDFKVSGWTPGETIEFIRQYMPELNFDQLIDEYTRWNHIGLYKGTNEKHQRRQFLTARKEGKRTIYKTI